MYDKKLENAVEAFIYTLLHGIFSYILVATFSESLTMTLFSSGYLIIFWFSLTAIFSATNKRNITDVTHPFLSLLRKSPLVLILVLVLVRSCSFAFIALVVNFFTPVVGIIPLLIAACIHTILFYTYLILAIARESR